MSLAIKSFALNHLLASLPVEEQERWVSRLELVHLPLGTVLYEPGGSFEYVHFPTTAVVSLMYMMATGGSAEIAVVGREGVVGIAAFLGGNTMPNRAVVQNAGEAIRLSVEVIKDEFNRSIPVMHLLLRYIQALITQMAQTAVCNRHHALDHQLCRLLLMRLDRMEREDLVMTQELISDLLGVRREGVTVAAHGLQRDGLISYSRGRITILDRPALERRSCECYFVVRKEYERLLPPTTAN